MAASGSSALASPAYTGRYLVTFKAEELAGVIEGVIGGAIDSATVETGAAT